MIWIDEMMKIKKECESICGWIDTRHVLSYGHLHVIGRRSKKNLLFFSKVKMLNLEEERTISRRQSPNQVSRGFPKQLLFYYVFLSTFIMKMHMHRDHFYWKTWWILFITIIIRSLCWQNEGKFYINYKKLKNKNHVFVRLLQLPYKSFLYKEHQTTSMKHVHWHFHWQVEWIICLF